MDDKIRLYVKAVTGRSIRPLRVREKPVGARLPEAAGEGTRKLRVGNGPPDPTVIRDEEVRSSQLRIQVEPRIYDSS